MTLDNNIIKKIQILFSKIESRDDLLDLLNYVKLSVLKGYSVPFSLKQLNYYSFPVHSKKKYKNFKIPKKNGSFREIHAPTQTLKTLQKTLSVIFQCLFTPHSSVTGFIQDKSIVDNARIHTGNNYVFNIDIKDFFTSIDQARVWACLKNPPFNLSGDKQIFANIIASICCTQLQIERKDEKGEVQKTNRNVLPQGAPTSPILSNIVSQRLDYQLSGVAKRFNLKYSRYADDITFSSMHNVYQKDSDFIKEVYRIIAAQNFEINESKIRLIKRNYRQEVTGLIVNEKANLSRRYIKVLRMWLYLWETYGFDKANAFFLQDYAKDKGHIKQGNPNFINVFQGKLDYLKMVVGVDSKKYKSLKKRFEELKPDTTVLNDNSAMTIVEETPIKTEKPKTRALDHKPKDTLSFLRLFQSSKGMKFLTHDWDDKNQKFDREKIVNIAKKEFEEAKRLYRIPTSILARFDEFAFKENPDWFNWETGQHKRINLGWSSKELINWYKNPLNEGTSACKNFHFSTKMIDPFKHSIEVRKGQLDKIFEQVTKNHLKPYDSFNIHPPVDLKKAKFYTDVNFFEAGLIHLFKSISDMAKYNNCYELEIKFEWKEEDGYLMKIITITHKNSIPERISSDKDLIKGDLGIAKEKFTGLCNWSIECKFEDGLKVKRRDILNDNGELEIKDIDKEEKGFTHILSFY